jgi:hypothetical protein
MKLNAVTVAMMRRDDDDIGSYAARVPESTALPLVRYRCRSGRGGVGVVRWSHVAAQFGLEETLVKVSDEPLVELLVAQSAGPAGQALLVVHGGPDWDHTYLREPPSGWATRSDWSCLTCAAAAGRQGGSLLTAIRRTQWSVT